MSSKGVSASGGSPLPPPRLTPPPQPPHPTPHPEIKCALLGQIGLAAVGEHGHGVGSVCVVIQDRQFVCGVLCVRGAADAAAKGGGKWRGPPCVRACVRARMRVSTRARMPCSSSVPLTKPSCKVRMLGTCSHLSSQGYLTSSSPASPLLAGRGAAALHLKFAEQWPSPPPPLLASSSGRAGWATVPRNSGAHRDFMGILGVQPRGFRILLVN